MAEKPDNTPRIKSPAPQVRGGNGVDVDLIRWMLSLTPLERLRAGQQFANAIMRLRARRISQGDFPPGLSRFVRYNLHE